MIISLLRKPILSTLASLPCGAINIDACRVGGDLPPVVSFTRNVDYPQSYKGADKGWSRSREGFSGDSVFYQPNQGGRFPANLILILSDAVLFQFPYTESGKAALGGHVRNTDKTRSCYGTFVGQRVEGSVLYGDKGSAARFFKVITQ